MVADWASQLLRLYIHYKNGLLPYAGGVLDQPQAFLISMEMIESNLNHDDNKS